MTEEEWLACEDPWAMLEFIGQRDKGAVGRLISWLGRGPTQTTVRKLRLLACACCRRNTKIMKVPQLREAIEASERFADGLTSAEELASVADKIRLILPSGELLVPSYANACAAALATTSDSITAHAKLSGVTQWVRKIITHELIARVCKDENDRAEKETLMPPSDYPALLRHTVGNPFRPYAVPDQWPSPVVKLAEAMYAGEDCSFALHDALMEPGHPELAEHFRDKDHPKGCWAIDIILGKQ